MAVPFVVYLRRPIEEARPAFALRDPVSALGIAGPSCPAARRSTDDGQYRVHGLFDVRRARFAAKSLDSPRTPPPPAVPAGWGYVDRDGRELERDLARAAAPNLYVR